MPDLPDELKDGETMGAGGGGSIFYGSRGILIADVYSSNARLVPFNLMNMITPPKPYLKRIPGGTDGHRANFVESCLNGGEASSDFSRSGPLTEAVLMGNLAIRAFQYKKFKEGKKAGDWDPFLYPGRRKLMWDGANMKVTNWDRANEWVKGNYRKGWELS